MLWRVLQSNNGRLPDEAIVCFANTGKEEEATLRFVRDCSVNWNVPITWVEFRGDEKKYAIVDFDRRSYAEMKKNASAQTDFVGFEDAIPCFCGD